MTTALAKAPAPDLAELLPVELASQLLAEWIDVDPVRQLHDQAAAVKTLLREQGASLEAQNKAGEIHLRAQRRLGQLLGEQKASGQRANAEDNLRRAPKAQPEPSEPAAPAPPTKPTLGELGIERNKAQRWQQLAKVPEAKFEGYLQAAKANGAEITTAGAMNHASRRNPHAASNVNNAEPDKNDRFTEREWVEALKKEFNLNWDFAGHELAPATEVFGRDRVWTIDDDCFRQDWSGKRGLLNPPWDELPRFVVFAWLKVATGECPLVVLPLPGTRWEQDWAQEFVHVFRPDEGGSGAVLRFPRGRKGYGTILDPEGKRPDNNVGLPSAELIIRGPFTRSPRLRPALTVEEVIAAQRFGDDKGLVHLWRQALAIARNSSWSGTGKHARMLADTVPAPEMPAASREVRANPVIPEKERTATGYQDVRPKGELRRMLAKERGETVDAPPSADALKSEVEAMGYKARVNWPYRKGHDGGRKPGTELIMVKCCGEDFNFRVADAAKGLERLRAHLKRRHAQQLEQVGAAFSIERFRGEATNLGFATRVVERATSSFVACRCGAKKCRTELRALVTPPRTVPLHQLQQLRDHYQEHARGQARKPRGSKPRGSKKKGGRR